MILGTTLHLFVNRDFVKETSHSWEIIPKCKWEKHTIYFGPFKLAPEHSIYIILLDDNFMENLQRMRISGAFLQRKAKAEDAEISNILSLNFHI